MKTLDTPISPPAENHLDNENTRIVAPFREGSANDRYSEHVRKMRVLDISDGLREDHFFVLDG